MKLLCSWIAAVAICLPSVAAASIETELQSVCQITRPATRLDRTSYGSGACYEVTDQAVKVLTAAHVVAGTETVYCRFWHQGYFSGPIAARVAYRDATLDFALLTLPRAAFGGILPHAVPLGTHADLPDKGAILHTAGCPQASRPTGTELHVIGYTKQGAMLYGPRPEEGRSGSAIFSRDGARILGVVTGYDPKQSVNRGGVGPTCDQMRARLAPRPAARHASVSTVETVETAACPPGAACGPNCKLLQRLRDRVDGKKTEQANPWPEEALKEVTQRQDQEIALLSNSTDAVPAWFWVALGILVVAGAGSAIGVGIHRRTTGGGGEGQS
jgi:hypothetical protein